MARTTTDIIIRYNDFGRDGKYVVILCHLGHLISHSKLDHNFGGSQLEADLGAAAAGQATHWHRLAANCCGAGHEPTKTPKHITPEPRVHVNPNTYKWRCPCCRKRNDDGDTTCIHCGQDVIIAA